MSRFREQFKAHPVHNTLTNLITLTETRTEISGAEEAKEKSSFLKITNIIKQSIDKIDPDLAPWQLLDQINNTLHGHSLPQIQAYSQNGNLQHIINANNQIRQHTAHLLPNLLSLTKFSVREKPLKSAEKVAKDFITQVQKDLEETDQKIEARKNELAVLEGQIRVYETPLEEMRRNWTHQYDEWIKEQRQKLKDDSTQLKKDLESKIVEEEQKLEATTRNAEKAFNEIKEMLGIATTGVINNDHNKHAKDEMDASVRWRFMALAFIIGAFAWLFYAYTHPPEIPEVAGDVYKAWIPILKTFSLTAVLLFAAGFTARHASSHLENARHLRGVALNVKALDPYLASLHPDQQKELKKELTEKLFGQSYIPQHKKQNNMDENKIMDIVERVLKFGK